VVSIIIVTWNSENYIKPCLLSILKQKDFTYSDYEIIVIDNNSKDKTISIIKDEFSNVLLVKNKSNLGYAKANNQGFKVAKGDYILLLNPDTKLQNDFFLPIIDFIKQHENVGAVAPKIVNSDLSIQHSIRSFPSYSILCWEFLGLSHLFPNNRIFGKWRMFYFNYNEIAQIDQPMASCLLVRKSAVDQIGYFDEKFPMFYNDVDFCYRLIQSGWQIYYIPKSAVIHERGASTKLVRNRMIFSMHKSLYHYFEKHTVSKSLKLIRLTLYPLLVFSAIIRGMRESFI
jgi:GT2 family glycosyltransferase